MDVGSISTRVPQAGLNVYTQLNNVDNTKTAKTNNAASQTAAQQANDLIGSAYSLDISAAGKKAAQAANDAAEDQGTQATKGLTNEQVQALQDDIAISQQTMLNMMIQALQDSNDKLQGWLDDGVGVLNFGGVHIDASRFGMPPVATTPEEAAAAVADGGDWSVDAVATRIFDLASAIAGNDPEKLATMRAAVEEGFNQAGISWNNATGLDKMPDITGKTYNEIMSRFDKRAEELGGIA